MTFRGNRIVFQSFSFEFRSELIWNGYEKVPMLYSDRSRIIMLESTSDIFLNVLN